MGMKGYPEAVISETLYADMSSAFVQGLTAWNRCANSVPHDGADVVFIVHHENRLHLGPSAAAPKV